MRDGELISADKLTKRFGATIAVRDVTFGVAAGEIVCLLGSNGAGKTTTINMFFAFTRPTSGRATIAGVDVDREPLRAKAEASYVAEDVSLYNDMTAFENVVYFAGLARGAVPAREVVLEALRRVGLDASATHRVIRSFSKGMRQKVGLALCVARETRTLFLDDPTIGLDPIATSELVSFLREERERERAILMATHDLFRTKELADRALIMKGGRVVAELSRRELDTGDLEAVYTDFMRE